MSFGTVTKWTPKAVKVTAILSTMFLTSCADHWDTCPSGTTEIAQTDAQIEKRELTKCAYPDGSYSFADRHYAPTNTR